TLHRSENKTSPILTPVFERAASNPSDRGLKRQKTLRPQAAAAAPGPQGPETTSGSEEVLPPPFPLLRSGRSDVVPGTRQALPFQAQNLRANAPTYVLDLGAYLTPLL
ncbi:hypothetical protein F442_22181, partial [Phytophthora nicotianae P10297]